jgi:hypothetical protein
MAQLYAVRSQLAFRQKVFDNRRSAEGKVEMPSVPVDTAIILFPKRSLEIAVMRCAVLQYSDGFAS